MRAITRSGAAQTDGPPAAEAKLTETVRPEAPRRPTPAPAVATSRWPRRLGLGLALAAILAAIASLMVEVAARIDTLRPEQAETLEWALSQVEVEFLLLDDATARAVRTPQADLAPLRAQFSQLDARLQAVRAGPRFAPLRDDPRAAAALARIEGFAEGLRVRIAGPGPDLRAALPGLALRMDALRPEVKALVLRGLTVFSGLADARRVALGQTLIRLALLVLALVAILGWLAYRLARLNRLHRARLAEIARTRARLQTILATTLDAVLVADDRGLVQEMNRAAEEMFGLSAAAARGRPLGALVSPPEGRAPEAALVAGRQRREGLRADGRRFPADVALAATDEGPGAEAGPLWIATIRDVSAQDAADRALREARDRALAGERAKAQFLAVMSHEMRTPLNGLLGTIELLAQGDLPPKQAEYVRIMQSSGRHLLRHVNDVLDIARAEAGQDPPASVPFDLTALIEELAASQRGLAEAGGNRLVLDLPDPPLPPRMGDPSRLRQVLLNLLGNAVKFTKDGTITLAAQTIGPERVELSVADTGVGIALKDQARIFSDFVTLDASYRRNAEGTGLGLGIARRMAEAMGGTIGVESTPGQGARFWLRLDLPRATAPLPRPAPAPEALPEVAPRDVLVVEDNRINRFVVREMLEGLGHRVTEAADGQEGVALAADHAFDAILMDISMPRMDGVEAARAIRSGGASAGAPIVALTAHAQPTEHSRFRAAGMSESLTKPVLRVELGRLLARLGEGAQGAPATAPATALHDAPVAPPVAPPPAPDLVDTGHLAELSEQVGPDLLPELRARFLEEGDMLLARPAPRESGIELAEALHRMAGSAAIFGARALQARLNRAETALRGGSAGPDWAELSRLWQDTRNEIATLLGQDDAHEGDRR